MHVLLVQFDFQTVEDAMNARKRGQRKKNACGTVPLFHPVVIKYTKVVAETRIYLVPPRSGRMPHLLCTKLLKFILNKIFVS